jgi:hypothetical protein
MNPVLGGSSAGTGDVDPSDPGDPAARELAAALVDAADRAEVRDAEMAPVDAEIGGASATAGRRASP